MSEFIIDNDNKAEWAINKIKEENEDIQRLISICENQIKEYQDKIKSYKDDLEQKTSYFKSMLNQYFQTVEHKKTKTAESYKLPSGTLKLKYKQNILKDDAMLLEWLKATDKSDYITIKTVPEWGEFKKTLEIVNGHYVTKDGEIVEGVKVEEGQAEFVLEL